MLWEGIVYRNSNFGINGTIDVMLYQKFKANGTSREYAKPFNKMISVVKSTLGIGKTSFGGGAITCECLVMSGPGNGSNSGSFSLPQVGTVGLVGEIGDKERFKDVFYVWLGGLYGNKQYGKNVKLPSDDTITDDINEDPAEYLTVLNIDNKIEEDTITESEYINSGAYILKTKTNCVKDYDNLDADKTDLEKILPENTFILTKEKAALRHDVNDYNDNKKIGIEQIFFDEGRLNIKRKIKKDDKLLDQDLTMDDEKVIISLVNEKKNAKTIVKLSTDGNVEVTTTGDLKVQTDGKMGFEAKKDVEIKTNGKMVLESDNTMLFKAKGQNFGKQVDNLAQAVSTLTTQGSPAKQAVMPETIKKGMQVSKTVSESFEG